MSATMQQLGTFDEILEALRGGREVRLEIPWFIEDDGRHELILVREEADRIVFFDPLSDDESTSSVGMFLADGLTPPRKIEPGGLYSLETAEIMARFELGEGLARLEK